MEFKHRLRALIAARGWTHHKAAEQLGCSASALTYWLIGGQPRLSTYQRLVATFPELREEHVA